MGLAQLELGFHLCILQKGALKTVEAPRSCGWNLPGPSSLPAALENISLSGFAR